MKHLFTAALLLIAALPAWAQQENFSFTIKEKRLPDNAKVFVRYMVDNKLVLDSVHFNRGRIHYAGSVNQPTEVMLFLSKNGGSFFSHKDAPMERLKFYVAPNTYKTVIRLNAGLEQAKIKGTEIEKQYKVFQKHMAVYNQQLNTLMKQRSTLYQQKPGNATLIAKVNEDIAALEVKTNEAKKVFIKKHSDSYFSLLSLGEVAGYHFDATEIKPLFLSLNAALRATARGKELNKNIALAERLAIGNQAPDFVQYSPEGKAVKLSDFRGKYVLIDFWASWCGPCRAENPNVLKAYKKFKSDKFEILGVSLDRPGYKANWLNAIAKDGLTWPQVSDLKGWQNTAAKAFGIRAIPQNYLIDPEGKIVAIDLMGDALLAKLKTVLKHPR